MLRRRALVVALAAAGCAFAPAGLPPPGADGDAARADGPARDGATPDAEDAPPATDAPPRFLLLVNVGGGDFVAADGRAWSADVFCTGDAYAEALEVYGTDDDVLYQDLLWADDARVACQLAVPAGSYHVTVRWAELWVGPGCPYPGPRLIDLYLEGGLVEDDLDVTSVGGCASLPTGSPVARSHDVAVADGLLDLVVQPANPSFPYPFLQALEIASP